MYTQKFPRQSTIWFRSNQNSFDRPQQNLKKETLFELNFLTDFSNKIVQTSVSQNKLKIKLQKRGGKKLKEIIHFYLKMIKRL